MSSHPKWGDPHDFKVTTDHRSNGKIDVYVDEVKVSERRIQVKASFNGRYVKEVRVPERRIGSFVMRKARVKEVKIRGNLSTDRGDVIPDNFRVVREFKYRCGLIRAINVLSGSNSTMTLYLDGFPNTLLDVVNTAFEFDSELEDGPVAEILYGGTCTKRGYIRNNNYYGSSFYVSLIFRDEAQMRECVVATATVPDPEKETVYRSSSSSSSSGGAWPFAIGYMLGRSR